MSTTSPTPYVPYQAYKSKRHSRVLSNPTPPPEVLPNGIVDPQNQTRHVSSSSLDSASRVNGESGAKVTGALRNDVAPSNTNDRNTPSPFAKSTPGPSSRPVSVMIVPELPAKKDIDAKLGSESTSPTNTLSSVTGIRLNGEPLSSTNDDTEPSSPGSVQSAPMAINGPSLSALNGKTSTIAKPSEKSAGKAPAVSTEAGPSSVPSSPTSVKSASEIPRVRKTSTFRYVPLRPPNASSSSTPRTSSPLRPAGPQTHSHSRAASTSGLSPPLSSPRQLGEQPSPLQTASRSPASIHSDLSPDMPQSALLNPATRNIHSNTHHRSTSMVVSSSIFPQPQPRINPPQRTSSLPPAPAPPPKPTSPSLSPSPGPVPASQPISAASSRVQSPSPIPYNTPTLSTSSSTSTPPTPTLSSAHKTVYRPGFQPKGVYRPLTDDFLALRKRARDRGRIEQTRLERRFEKLVDLHFSPNKEEEDGSGKEKTTGTLSPGLARRASSFFEELGDLKGKSATELWRSVLESRAAAANGGKSDIRSAEQRITPWQDDAEVPACPHCSASFHPLTNRKHHCRLCGRIICSLPVKKPQRPVPCSLLFVSEPKTGRIEEVTEGVDYGVRPRARVDSKVGRNGGSGGGGPNEEKFLKGVRICRECKPVMLRQQYRQEAKRVPVMVRLYEALISLESEIEETLPQFQELMLSLSNNPDEAPTKEASAARKHLLECFADYDAIAKRIRKIPCAPGGSQDRIQAAIVSRANMFLQKNMFPLQSLPKPKRRSSMKAASGTDGAPSQVIDPDSELAQALQPLLEQEALLESFVEEATTHRKFEDARILKANLAEIRAEIDRIVIQADGGP